MTAELHNGINPFTRFRFKFFKWSKVSGKEYHRLFAYNVGSGMKAKSDMGIVHMVRGTDCHEIDSLIGFAFQFFKLSLETFELCKEFSFREIGIEDPDGIMRIEGRGQNISGIFDGFQVARSDIPGYTGHGKSFH